MPSSFQSGKEIKPGQDLVAGTLLSTSVLEAIPDAVRGGQPTGLYYSGQLPDRITGLDEGIRLLEKPFTRRALLKILDEVLGPAA